LVKKAAERGYRKIKTHIARKKKSNKIKSCRLQDNYEKFDTERKAKEINSYSICYGVK